MRRCLLLLCGLGPAVHALVASPGMGSAYKAFALAHFGADAAGNLDVAGFAANN